MMSNEWKLPLNIAVAIHVLILLGALYLPGIFKSKPKFADIYTVSIINIAEPNTTPPPAAASAQETSPPPVVAPPKPVKTEKIAPIAEPVSQEKSEPVPQKSISLKPLKKKKIQEIKPAKEPNNQEEIDQKNRQRLAEAQKNRQRLAEALREEELLAERAKLAQEALEIERKLLESQRQVNASPIHSVAGSGNMSSTSAAAAGSSNLLESQYLAAIFNRLHQFWTPPEYLQKNPDLTAVVIVTITQDGQIANMQFESKSGDRVFDQFVNKTLEAAAPMPPIPPALKKQRFELGLRFRPGSIQ
jgi:TonB family protein